MGRKSVFKIISAVGAALVCLVLPARAEAVDRQQLRNHVPTVVAQLKSIGQLPGTNRLSLTIGLPLRDKQGLAQLLAQVSDPTSPKFHQYLTPRTFADEFGPTEADYQSVVAFAKSSGLTVTGVYSDRTMLQVSGPVEAIEKALHVTLRVYSHPREARTFYAPDVEPSLDLLVPVLQISGLDNYVLPLSHVRATPISKPGPNAAVGSAPGGNYAGNDLRTAYAQGVSLNGAGQSVGIFDPPHGFMASDIEAYEDQTGIAPHVNVTKVLVDGIDAPPDGFSIEVTLDIDMAIAMAPKLSEVLVYEGVDGLKTLKRMATDNKAKQLSISWIPPPEGANADQIYQQLAIQGQSFFAASGDDGSYYPTVPQWADDPYITVVGGTVLTTSGPGGSWLSESTWQGSGGGSSATYLGNYSIPSWQRNVSMSTNYGSTAMRNSPDVAMVAAGIFMVLNGGGISVEGTSAAAPLWAGFTALVNQQAANLGRQPVGFINPSIYALNGQTFFHDISTGNNLTPWNKQPGNDHEYDSVPGFDLCSGWGTPIGLPLMNAMNKVQLIAPLRFRIPLVWGGCFLVLLVLGRVLVTRIRSQSQSSRRTER